jgi:hypothetical protein
MTRMFSLARLTRSCVNRFLPDAIKGDLDSLRDDVRNFYESRVGQPIPMGAFQMLIETSNHLEHGRSARRERIHNRFAEMHRGDR